MFQSFINKFKDLLEEQGGGGVNAPAPTYSQKSSTLAGLNNCYHLNFINIYKKTGWLFIFRNLVNLTISARVVLQKAVMWPVYTDIKKYEKYQWKKMEACSVTKIKNLVIVFYFKVLVH